MIEPNCIFFIKLFNLIFNNENYSNSISPTTLGLKFMKSHSRVPRARPNFPKFFSFEFSLTKLLNSQYLLHCKPKTLQNHLDAPVLIKAFSTIPLLFADVKWYPISQKLLVES
jgi:hypothetical protein